MPGKLLSLYNRLVLGHPLITLLLTLTLVAGMGWFAKDFRLDASADSLVLENDADLRYYREIRERYGSDDFLIVTYTPRQDLFSKDVLSDLRLLRDSLRQLERVAEVVSILDVPLIDSSDVTLADIGGKMRTLENPDTDLQTARNELLTNPLYNNRLISENGQTTAMRITFETDETFLKLREERNRLRQKRDDEGLSETEKQELAHVSKRYFAYSAKVVDRESEDIARIRAIIGQHQHGAELHLGGVPMIVADMVSFIRSDLTRFGAAVVVFMIVMLALIFRRLRWVLLPMLCCAATLVFMFGFLGLVEWRVTVVSSNFTSLLLIITMSLTVHLAVRYHELHDQDPDADQRDLVLGMVRSKAIPCLYTALTTIVAFVSLLVSDIRPVIDFGWMMAIGIVVAFMLSFLLLPAALMFFTPDSFHPKHDVTGMITRRLDRVIERHGTITAVVFVLVAVLSVLGISRLTVENRFIDYFKKSTEIYQGMTLIDRNLGGTTPLELIVDPPPGWQQKSRPSLEKNAIDDPFAESGAEGGLTSTSYWYTSYRIDIIRGIHDQLESYPATGKALSMATTFALLGNLNQGEPLDNLLLSVIQKKVPQDIERTLMAPYITEDGNQLRFAMRIQESDRQLQRTKLLQTIRHDLTKKIGLEEEQVHLTGMFVLYNNVLQSLYRSQILTLSAVFVAIMLMFMVLFRSIPLALIAIVPNLVAAGSVLGLMGWLGIPLDIMTITIAAITIGIAVDDTIHYVHRFMEELPRDGDYKAAIRRCHASVGRALYYTTITIVAGFSILVLSNFIPTVYFGLLTGLAMLVAIIADLTLLALLILRFRPPVEGWLFRSGSDDGKK
jgi:predicted RND superfamily exporter protein